ncbi:hypothetical protein SEMRO_84_G044610.1 [Seminavis robusta]|uniref:Uncharacterized protein n=1 Tax=Seminavis robusta TaxID=568900 RepID=A0A9N8H3B0_9STRA|nr:hypothetical protein SEMRO_84_G044610.1 [Seminavis robusta]|eukprot:Sro84_g044610.1 n/a (159) ;mRNA; r:4459-4935
MMSPPSADNEAIRNMTLSDDSSTTGEEGVVESSGSSDSSNTTTTPRYHYKGCHTPPKAPKQIFARSAEKIARRKGHMRWLDKHQGVKWDNTTDVMAGLDRFVIKKLRNSACEIMWQFFPMRSEGFSSATYTGQGGLVRGPDGTVKFLTAAHNTCSEND